ncbi:MAG: efflux RND transporter permease subunit [Thermoanaerobaculales bacterium]|nr:efflux RND transporter permease subunit [Thermoanaerobaculales bacterium]
MKIVDLSIRRPVSVFIFAVAAVIFGWVAFGHLPVNLLPDITYPSLTVRTEYKGYAPAEVESLLTRPAENAVGVVNNVVRVFSSSRADVSEVTLEFAWGTNMDFAALDVRERLDSVHLPADADQPVLLRYDPSLDPIMRIGVFGSDDLARLRFVAEEDIERALERIEGVAAVVVSGGLEEEIQVALDEHKLSALGMTVDEVATRLAAENVNLTGGALRDGRSEYLVRTLNEFLRADDLESVVIRRSGAAIIRLQDVASVFTGHKERDIITRINGLESVELAVYKEGGSNTVSVSDAVTTRLGGLRENLGRVDPSLEFEIITDQARYIRQSISEVLQTALYGGLLAILVLFFFLRSVQKTLIIGISIPVSVVATFFAMYLADISLNIMSLGGLTLGVGLLVDNAIVVLEAVQRRTEQGMNQVEAARQGASEVGRAITASTLTTICVFVPIVFVEGVTAQLFRDQALTVACSLAVSLVVALTVIPMLVSRDFGRRLSARNPDETDETDRTPQGLIGRIVLGSAVTILRPLRRLAHGIAKALGLIVKPFLDLFDRALAGFALVYERSLDVVLRNPGRTLLVTLLLFVGSLSLYRQLGKELIPELIQGEFYANVELPPGTRLEVTDRRLSDLGRVARDIEGVRTVYTIAGATNDQGGAAGETRESIGQLTVTLEPPVSEEREDAAIERIRSAIGHDNARLSSGFASIDGGEEKLIEAGFGRPSYFSFKTAIEVEIRGFNLVLLERLANEATGRMRAISGLADVKSSTEGGHPELQIRFDRDRLAAYGLNVANVAALVRAKVEGELATEITRSDRTIDIRLRVAEAYRDSALDLGSLTAATIDGVAIPLSAITEIVNVEGPAEIRRADGARVARISANLKDRDLGSAAEAIEEALNDMSWPNGYDWRLGGQEEEMQTSFDSMKLAIALAIFMVYLVMASQFEDLLHPFVILFAVPFAAIGALGTMWLFEITVNVVSMIGFVLLAGIVVNDAIVKIDYTNQLRKQGMAKIEAIKTAGLVRLRPILMTTATTVLGLLPMALGLGEGAELRTPMALTVIGGLMTSTLLTLLVVPAVYVVLDRRA